MEPAVRAAMPGAHAAPGQRFVIMDGLRGVCAIAVLLYHSSFLQGLDQPTLFPSGYLAVDCFFLMSGYVLCYAYGRLFDERRTMLFLRKRIARLAPVWWAGLGIAAITLVLQHAPARDGLVLLANALFLPTRYVPHRNLFPANIPGWSLFFELLINLAYIMLLHRLPRAALIAIMVCAGIAIIALSAGDMTMNGGVKWSGFPTGLARVTYAFLAGALLFRAIGRTRTLRAAIWAPLLCLVVIPLFAVHADGRVRWLFELAMLFLVFPALVAACAWFAPPRWAVAPLERLGLLSYPLYVIHFPLLALARNLYGRAAGFDATIPDPMGAVVLIAIVAFAYLIGVKLDPLARRIGSALEGRPRSA